MVAVMGSGVHSHGLTQLLVIDRVAVSVNESVGRGAAGGAVARVVSALSVAPIMGRIVRAVRVSRVAGGGSGRVCRIVRRGPAAVVARSAVVPSTAGRVVA